MSAAVCRSSAAAAAAAAGFEPILAPPTAAVQQQKPKPTLEEDEHVNNDDAVEGSERPPGQFAIWTSIQAQKAASAQQQGKDEPLYVHPLLARRSSSLLSQQSLETCTESLGSETGSDDFLSSDDETTADFFSLVPEKEEEPQQQQQQQQQEEREADNEDGEDDDEELEYATEGKRELVTVNYHCSISRRSALPRSFPPPLPSISRRDGPCLQMRPHRRDGRLVVEAVAVPSQNYLHAERHNGRLLLSFIDTTSSFSSSCRNGGNGAAVDCTAQLKEAEPTQDEEAAMMMMIEEAEADDEDQDDADVEEEEEEEVEVVDRGTVVEVKVSTQPQQSGAGGAATTKKVHRSSIVINKFVSCTPAIAGGDRLQEAAFAAEHAAATRPSVSPARRLSTATTTAAAAAVAASSLSALSAGDGSHSSTNDNKLLFTSRRRSREELMHDMRRCSQLRKPLFIWEPCCIATSS